MTETDTTNEAPAPATVGPLADLADKAADVIEANGLHQFGLYDPQQADGTPPLLTRTPLDQCRVDVFGAINIAADGSPRCGAAGPLTWELECQLCERLDDPCAWNDEPGRTADDVARMLRRIAAELRGGTA